MQPQRIKSITEFHRQRNLAPPEHPLISVINFEHIGYTCDAHPIVMDFYSISLKKNTNTKIKYGQSVYDFDEGTLFFMSPGQVFQIQRTKDATSTRSGWLLLVHPDFLWNTPLAKDIRLYEFFGYATNEALFLSAQEEEKIAEVISQIQKECRSNIDKFTQNIIIAQLNLLLSYSERFYNRQFITRKVTNHQVLERLEHLLNEYFNGEEPVKKGIPTVQFVAEALNISPNYLSGLLKVVTGSSTQQHIHNFLIEKAKEKLSTTNLSVSEIAYELGFEHPQSFSKLFKAKTRLSPLEFRQSFN
ncbi:AraC-like DNA-binding protein [Chitinophaga terrae (ex Kim and Jung 2007)]|uniref:helix-turn-helix domain-containing protein n=1 Tax=Chitinophaga terrae (ex Kim and Jung 2007) TaxID=408074 RepID=UPI00277E8276|nr:helix-turn-helix transcriptional regulator [Chitinophaga terrae (ex Kim and Jung 2007)]MDQ0105352.1 AraC-like DNA-binding protein [Chitinophaga terrae (ex Kim and Jung 2007)]